MNGPVRSALWWALLAAALLAGAGIAAAAAGPDEGCRAQPVGSARLMKSHSSRLGRCFETDRGDDPHRFG